MRPFELDANVFHDGKYFQDVIKEAPWTSSIGSACEHAVRFFSPHVTLAFLSWRATSTSTTSAVPLHLRLSAYESDRVKYNLSDEQWTELGSRLKAEEEIWLMERQQRSERWVREALEIEAAQKRLEGKRAREKEEARFVQERLQKRLAELREEEERLARYKALLVLRQSLAEAIAKAERKRDEKAAILGSLAAASPLQRRSDFKLDASPGDPHIGAALPVDYVGPTSTGGTWSAGFEKAKAIVEEMTLAELVNVTTGFLGPCSGNAGAVPRLGLKARCLEDGPLGVRPTDYVSQFPAGVTVAATWDTDLFYQRANAIGQEVSITPAPPKTIQLILLLQFHDKGAHVALGPVTGGPIGRSPLAGRNWEGGSPDNYLNGVLSYIGVKGLQDAGVQASAKHFIAYEQETWRTYYWAATKNNTQRNQQIDSYLDDTTMHELYLTSFAEAVRAGAASVMCSYNSVNGQHACGNNHTLNGLLKTELGFQGYVVSDWGGTWGTTDSLAGLDQEMPGTGYDDEFGDFLGKKLVRLKFFCFNLELTNPLLPQSNLSLSGGIEVARLKDMAIRSLTPYYQLGQDSDDYPEVSYDMASLGDGLIDGQWVVNQHVNVQRDHYKIIRTVGEASATLLKNVVSGGKGLPITNSTTRIGIFGQDATYQSGGLTGCGSAGDCTLSSNGVSNAGYGPNGTQSSGGGSGTALAPYVYTPLEAITARGRRSGLKVDYELNDSNDTLPFVTVTAGNVQKAEELFIQLSMLYLTSVHFSAFQTEGFDRDDLQLSHNGATLIKTVAAACSDVIVVIHSGGQVDMESFAEHENITAIVFAYYPGQETGAAIDSVLFGDVSPSGKLPWTIGKSLEDYPSGAKSVVRDDVKTPNSHFTEGVFIDYKWFDAKNITPRYPFGFGLRFAHYLQLSSHCYLTNHAVLLFSYSTFAFSDATIASNYLLTPNIQFIAPSTQTADANYVQKTNEVLSGGGDLYDQLYTVGVTLKNTGDVYAAEVAQVYLSFPKNVTNQPPRLLRGFSKVYLNPGESRTLTFPIRAKDIALWETKSQESEEPASTLYRKAPVPSMLKGVRRSTDPCARFSSAVVLTVPFGFTLYIQAPQDILKGFTVQNATQFNLHLRLRLDFHFPMYLRKDLARRARQPPLHLSRPLHSLESRTREAELLASMLARNRGRRKERERFHDGGTGGPNDDVLFGTEVPSRELSDSRLALESYSQRDTRRIEEILGLKEKIECDFEAMRRLQEDVGKCKRQTLTAENDLEATRRRFDEYERSYRAEQSALNKRYNAKVADLRRRVEELESEWTQERIKASESDRTRITTELNEAEDELQESEEVIEELEDLNSKLQKTDTSRALESKNLIAKIESLNVNNQRLKKAYLQSRDAESGMRAKMTDMENYNGRLVLMEVKLRDSLKDIGAQLSFLQGKFAPVCKKYSRTAETNPTGRHNFIVSSAENFLSNATDELLAKTHKIWQLESKVAALVEQNRELELNHVASVPHERSTSHLDRLEDAWDQNRLRRENDELKLRCEEAEFERERQAGIALQMFGSMKKRLLELESKTLVSEVDGEEVEDSEASSAFEELAGPVTSQE
ncbi:beta-glucosidase, partial [Phenoliferia sp. Uapishka_3]